MDAALGQTSQPRVDQALIAEARADVGTQPADRAMDVARAVARLGVARGITAFSRYAFLERNGQANLAIPVGRWYVQAQPYAELIDAIAPWLDGVTRAARDEHAPAGMKRQAQACEAAVFECCRAGSDPARWQALLGALGEAESAIPRSPRFAVAKRLRPLPVLSDAWIEAAADGSVEFRLACALASQRVALGASILPVRRHFLPLDGRSFAASADRLLDKPSVVCTTRRLERDLVLLVQRVLAEASQAGTTSFPLFAHPVEAQGWRTSNRFSTDPRTTRRSCASRDH